MISSKDGTKKKKNNIMNFEFSVCDALHMFGKEIVVSLWWWMKCSHSHKRTSALFTFVPFANFCLIEDIQMLKIFNNSTDLGINVAHAWCIHQVNI